MRLGNWPDGKGAVVDQKIYWRFILGKQASISRFYDWGWRGLEFLVVRYDAKQPPGRMMPHLFRIAFSFWLPIDAL